MKIGNGLFNHKCHLNAVQEVKKGNMEEVYSCICFSESSFPVVHFINKDKEGYFIDNTLGWQYKNFNYYIINKIDESQFNNIDKVLMDLKKMLLYNCSNSFINKLFKINEESLGI